VAKVCSECRLSGGNGSVRFIDERDLGVRIIDCDCHSQGSISAAKVNDPQRFGGLRQMIEQKFGALIQARGAENARMARYDIVAGRKRLWPWIVWAFHGRIGIAEDESGPSLGERRPCWPNDIGKQLER
jgi:hypothetical protein